MLAQEGPGPDQPADARDQQDHTDYRPDHVFGTGLVVDQRFMGPVVGIGNFAVRALGGSGPGGPEKELGHLLTALGAGQGVLFHGIVFTGGLQLRRVAEQPAVVIGGLGNGGCPASGQVQGAGGIVVSVTAILGFQLVLQGVLLLAAEAVPVLPEFFPGGDVEPVFQLPVQPVRGPVRCLVGAVTPNRPELHATDRLPGSLAIEDAFLGHQKLTGFADHPVRDGGAAR